MQSAQIRSARIMMGRRIIKQHHMIQAIRNSYDLTNLLQQCKVSDISKVHSQIVTGGYGRNPFVGTKLIGRYSESASPNMEHARKVFDGLSDRDVFLWNMIIQGYANSGPSVEAVNMYKELCRSSVLPNQYTFPFVFKACAAMRDQIAGILVHAHAIKLGFGFNLFVGNALVAFYAKCQNIDASRCAFDQISPKDLVSWNSIISGYTTNGYYHEALVLFHAIQKSADCKPDNATLVAILPACTQLASVQDGLWIHTYILKRGMEINAALGSGLIAMYGNCGRLNDARWIFDHILNKTVVVWNAIIRCYGMHGHADEAAKLFSRMIEDGVCPDSRIFLGLLSTCSHAGMVTRGRELFESMGDYGVERSIEHYACMVDLLGRAGFLKEAMELIEAMPLQPGKDVYGALLGACRIHNNMELAEKVAKKLFVLDPENAARLVTLANMYEDKGRLADAAMARKMVREKKLKKSAGYSSVELDFVYHTFGVEDESHPFTELIFDTLEKLYQVMVMEDDLTLIS